MTTEQYEALKLGTIAQWKIEADDEDFLVMVVKVGVRYLVEVIAVFKGNDRVGQRLEVNEYNYYKYTLITE